MVEDLQTITCRELMSDVVQIQQIGVPCGLFEKRTEPGFVLKNGTVLLESEKDEQGHYIGGAGLDGMYLRTPERYEPIRGDHGEILSFRRVDPQSALNRWKAREERCKADQKNTGKKRRQMER